MKCDKLEELYAGQFSPSARVYGALDVTEAIAELKSEIKRKEAVEQRWFEHCMEARSEAIRLKRALWIARAKRAIEKISWFKLCGMHSISTMNPEDGARQEFDKWKKALGKFLNKAEEYR
jgi:hypothetical protein